MLQAISAGGGEVALQRDGQDLLVHPGRDVAYCLPKIARVAVANLDRGRWKQAKQTADQLGLTSDEVGDAFVALINFINAQPDELEEDQTDTMVNSLARAGFLKCKAEAQVLAMAYFAQPVLGMFWKGVRDAGGRPQDATYSRQLTERMNEAVKAFREMK